MIVKAHADVDPTQLVAPWDNPNFNQKTSDLVDQLEADLNGPNSRAPIIYALSSGTHVKIGFTTKFSARVRSIQTGCPTKLILLTAYYGNELEEAKWHKLLASSKSNGEWFNITSDVHWALIDMMMAGWEFSSELAEPIAGGKLRPAHWPPKATELRYK